MSSAPRLSLLGIAAISVSVGLGTASCFVSLDESKIQEGPPTPAADAGPDADADASVNPDSEAGKEDVNVPESSDEADTSDAEPPDAADAADTSDPDAGDAADGSEPDGDAAVGPDTGLLDGPLVECVDDSDCAPIGCSLRICNAGACQANGVIHEDVGTFELPAPLACSQSFNRSCVVAARNYLVALTDSGFVAFNTRNPKAVQQEPIPDVGITGYAWLVRSGERIWAVQGSGSATPLAWLDIPLDGVSPFSPPSTASVFVPNVAARLPAPNDAIFLYLTDSTPMGYFARFAPGLPTSLGTYATNGATEFEAVAASASRALLHERVIASSNPTTYQHRFSLQSDVASSMSANGGAYDETSLINSNGTYGYFASSRKGAIAWVIGRDDGSQWRDVRTFWLVSGPTTPLESTSVVIETFTAPPPSVPEGPLAFISDDTIATAVIAAGSFGPSLDVVRRTGTNAPALVKRIPISSLAPGALNVAGDNGYAYVVTGTTVRIFAPLCNP